MFVGGESRKKVSCQVVERVCQVEAMRESETELCVGESEIRESKGRKGDLVNLPLWDVRESEAAANTEL